MSHYATIKTRLVDQDYLVRALEDIGYKGQVEVHEEPIQLRGYRGDRRRQKAEIVIQRKHVGRSSNDIGFHRTAAGHYNAMISGYDRSRHNKKWLGQLTQRYAYHAAVDKLRDQGFEIVEEAEDKRGQLNVTLRRAV